MCRSRVMGTLGVVALFALGNAAIAAGDSSISVLGSTPLEVSGKQGQDEASASFSVLNKSAKPVTVNVKLRAASSDALKLTKPTSASLPPTDATPVKITIAGLKQLSDKASGQILLTGAGAGDPVAQTLSITPGPQPSWEWPTIFIWTAIGFALVIALGVPFKAAREKKQRRLFDRAPGPEWGFDSWATTFTGAGALLTTVLAAATFPDAPKQISKDTLVELSLLFAGVVVAAPLIFQAIRDPKAPASEKGLWGYNYGLLIAIALTTGAVFGQLATLALLTWELTGGDTAGWGVIAALGVVALAAFRYCTITAYSNATTNWAAVKAKATKEAAEEHGRALTETFDTRADGKPEVIVVPAPAPLQQRWTLP